MKNIMESSRQKRVHGKISVVVLLLLLAWTQAKAGSSGKVRVGVFNGHGGAQTCIWETVTSIMLDPDMEVRTVGSADMANNVLDSLDAIVFPGGGGSTEYLNLGEENIRRVKAFVALGKGVVGICAGAYLLSDTPSYACLAMNGAKAIDIEHDNRGHGVSKFTLTEEGKRLFPELACRDTSYVFYYEGPVFEESGKGDIAYATMAMMESDVHEEGNAPVNMTNNKPFFIANSYGKGRVFSSIAHPEATPGMAWMIPRMVRWTLRMPIKKYKSRVVNPDVYNREILMSKADLKREKECYDTLLYASPAEKVAALDWLQSCRSWEAKRWVQGLLYDGSAEVRARAARFIAETDYLIYLRDVEAAYRTEKDAKAKRQIKMSLQHLRELLP
ncbi:MAG: BPL-N domain-containing protein [Prevotella sp.]|nr:BPL-N domain-containing protein [Prevotella sp.]